MKHTISDVKLVIQVDERLYHEDVIFKCFYWYAGNFQTDISRIEGHMFEISLTANEPVSDWEVVLGRIQRDLVDFKLRDIVTKETVNIRELIVAKAFAYAGLSDNLEVLPMEDEFPTLQS
jgi:His-Xaa-Ser system protein HxsD